MSILTIGEMRTDELQLERRCCQQARLNGWVAVKLEKNAHKGIPDRIFLHPDGKFVLIEFKKDTKQRPRPEQQVWLQKFVSSAYLIGSYEDFCRVLGISP